MKYKKIKTAFKNAIITGLLINSIFLQSQAQCNFDATKTDYKNNVILQPDGSIWSWGFNSNGQLGLGHKTKTNVPAPIGTDHDWKTLITNDNYNFAIKNDNSIWAWGGNSSGNLGIGTLADTTVPAYFDNYNNWDTLYLSRGFQNIIGVATAHFGIKTNGSLWAWGSNTNGILGISAGTSGNSNLPVQVGTSNNWKSVFLFAYNTYAIQNDGTLWAWGNNSYGQLGVGLTGIASDHPIQVGTNTNWKAIFCESTCHTVYGLQTDGTLWSWGSDFYAGGLGTAVSGNSNIPVQVGTDNNWQHVEVFNSITVAYKTNGEIWAWGNNDYGQLFGGSTTFYNTPVLLENKNNWKQIAFSEKVGFAIKNDNTLWTWGGSQTASQNTLRQIGTQNNWNKFSFIQYDAFNQVNFNMLALQQDSTLWAWGINFYGQIGDSTLLDKAIPTQITNSHNWTNIKANAYTSFANKADNSLWAWGQNNYGVMGDSTFVDKHVPTPMAHCKINTGIHNLNNTLQLISLAPNPSADYTQINILDNKIQINNITITDITGAIVENIIVKNDNIKINTSAYNNGLYFIRANNIVTKLVVQH